MKITIYELLGRVKDDSKTDIYVKYINRISEKEEIMWACKENIIYKLDQIIIKLNDEVEIIEEEKDIEKLEMEKGSIEDKTFLAKYITHNRYKINELVKAVNELKNK